MKRTSILALIFSCQIGVSAALGATVWDGEGTDNNWTTAANWVGDVAPGTGNAVEVQFAGSTRLAPNVDTNDPWMLQKVTFNSGAGAFVIGGNAVSLQGNGELMRNNSSSTQTFDNNVQIKGTGWNTINAASGDIVINGGLDLQTSVSARGNRNVTVNGLITGSGTSIGRTDGGILRLTNPNNSFTGVPSIAHGVLEISNIADSGVNSAIGAGNAIALGQGTWGPSDTGTLRYTGPSASTNRQIRMTSNSDHSHNSDPNATYSGRPTIEITDPGTTLTFNGDFVYNGSSTLGQWRLRGAGTGVINGNILTTGAQLEKSGTGTWVLRGTSTFAGSVTIAEGTVDVIAIGNQGVAGNLGAGTTIILGSAGRNGTLKSDTEAGRNTNRNIVLAAGGSGTIRNSYFMDINGVISGDGDLHKTGTNQAGNNGTRLSLNTVNTYTGDTYIDEGVIQVSGSGTIPDTSDVHIAGGAGNGRLRLNKAEAINGLFGDGTVQTFSGNPQTLTVGAAGGDGDFSGVIEGGISLVKAGAGTQVLRGTSTYTGTTVVQQGSLIVNGSIASSSLTTVAAPATLGGTGTVGVTTVSGTVAPGASAGTLNTGTLTLLDASVLDFELGPPGIVGGGVNDLIDVAGDLHVDDGTVTLDVTPLAGFGLGTYTLITFSGSIFGDGTNFQIGDAPTSIGSYRVLANSFATGGGNVQLMAVPEPSSLLLAVAGLLALLAVGRRRRRAACSSANLTAGQPLVRLMRRAIRNAISSACS